MTTQTDLPLLLKPDALEALLEDPDIWW